MSRALLLPGLDVEARACFVGERIDVRGLDSVAEHPTVIRVGEGCAVVFRYGAIVAFGIPRGRFDELLAELAPRVANRYEHPEGESAAICIAPDQREGVVDQRITLSDGDMQRLQLVAEILAKSVVLAQYEREIAEAFNLVEPLAEQLERGAYGGRARELLQHIGRILRIQHKMVGRVEVLEKPELLWEHAQLERLYARLEDEYELRERNAALERKLDLISTTAATVLEIFQTRRALRLEWYIVILILVEIALLVYELVIH